MHPILIADHAAWDARKDLADTSTRFSEATLLRLALGEPQLTQYRTAYAAAAIAWSRGSDNFDQVWREASQALYRAEATATPIMSAYGTTSERHAVTRPSTPLGRRRFIVHRTRSPSAFLAPRATASA